MSIKNGLYPMRDVQAAINNAESKQVLQRNSIISDGVRTVCPALSSIQLVGGRAYSH